MDHELSFGGVLYISSKRAAQKTGYAKDYIGQLCRMGKMDCRLVGRNWYISEPSLESYIGYSREELAKEIAKELNQVDIPSLSPREAFTNKDKNRQNIFEDIIYKQDDRPLVPYSNQQIKTPKQLEDQSTIKRPLERPKINRIQQNQAFLDVRLPIYGSRLQPNLRLTQKDNFNKPKKTIAKGFLIPFSTIIAMFIIGFGIYTARSPIHNAIISIEKGDINGLISVFDPLNTTHYQARIGQSQ